MISFLQFFESYDTVQDFLSHPIHNSKDQFQWMEDFVDSGGQVMGMGNYGSVYAHPKWPYVVKTFKEDSPYIRFMRWAHNNPHSAFPKMFGKPKAVIPPYTRDWGAGDDRFFAVRLEKLKPISYETYGIFQKYHKPIARYFHMMGDPDEFNRQYPDPQSKQEFINNGKEMLSTIPENVIKAIEGYYSLYLANREFNFGDEDLHQGNMMVRDNGEIVLTDPLWYGYNPNSDADHREKMEMDYYGGGEHEEHTPKKIPGGKRNVSATRLKKRRDAKKYQKEIERLKNAPVDDFPF